MLSTPYIAARPTIRVAGEVRPRLAEDLLTLEVTESTDGLHHLEAGFANWGMKASRVDFLYFDRQVLEFGADVGVELDDRRLFEGRVTGVEGRFPDGRPPQVSILAEDALQDLRMTRRSRTFEGISDRDLFESIAQDHGLQTDLGIDGPTHQVLAQLNQSDLAFLRERATAIGAEVWVEGRTLSARPRSDRTSAALVLTYGGGLREFDVLADLAHQCTTLSLGGWNTTDKEAIAAEVGDEAIESELAGTQSGGDVLRTAFGVRRQVVAHAAPHTAHEARLHAEATYRRLARRFVVGRGVAEPDARLRVGATVDLRGLGPLFSGAYRLVRTCYRFDTSAGSRVEFTAERSGLGRP